MPGEREPAARAVDVLIWLADHTADTWGVRQVAREMNTSPSTIHRIFQIFESRDLVIKNDEGRYTPGLELFRICQGALMNTLNHAQASQVSVTIADTGKHIQLTVSDDGQGFEVGKHHRNPGLIRMRERAASINGELTIQSEVGKGTRICVSIEKQQ